MPAYPVVVITPCVCAAVAKLAVVYPLSLMSFPVVPENVAIRSAVTEAGPITAPSILVCATVQWALFADVLLVIHIIKSPTSQTTPA